MSSKQAVEEFRRKHDIRILKGFSERQSDLKDHIIRNFRDVEWPFFIEESLKKSNFQEPTPIQSEAWPILLKGHNLVGVSETGSGKTLGYALPALWHIYKQVDDSIQGPMVLVIAPVRELASQINEQITSYCYRTNIRTAAVFGGAQNKSYQIKQLSRRPQIVVCTPGRLGDLVNSGFISLQNVSCVVLDEADRLLDMGFESSIRSILKHVRPDRQISLFTATWPKEVRSLASELMGNSFYRLTVGGEVSPAKSVSQHIEICEEYEKLDLLIGLLKMKFQENPNSKALIFCNKKMSSISIANSLRRNRFGSECFHGDMEQNARDRALAGFRDGSLRILVASDAAARGLDVKDITLVVNYDFPNDMETYVHRIGRTGRAGSKGDSISFVTSDDQKKYKDIVKLLTLGNQPIPPQLMSSRYY
jgi:superfamily II DNA/RNA helicase